MRKSDKKILSVQRAPLPRGAINFGATRTQVSVTRFLRSIDRRRVGVANRDARPIVSPPGSRSTLSGVAPTPEGPAVANPIDRTSAPVVHMNDKVVQDSAAPLPTRPTPTIEMPYSSASISDALAQRWATPPTAKQAGARNKPDAPAGSDRLVARAPLRDGRQLARPPLPSASWLGISPPAPEPVVPEISRLLPIADHNGDEGIDPPATSPLPVSALLSRPVVSGYPVAAAREQVTAPPVVRTVLAMPRATETMAMPYAPTAHFVEPTQTASQPGMAAFTSTPAKDQSAAADLAPSPAADPQIVYSPAALSDDGEVENSPVVPRSVNRAPISSRREAPTATYARTSAELAAGALSIDQTPHQLSTVPAQRPQPATVAATEIPDARFSGQAQTLRWREASAEPLPMPLARTSASPGSANGNGHATSAGSVAAKRIERWTSPDGIVHRRVIVQRVAAGESPAGNQAAPAHSQGPAPESEHHASQEQGQTGDEGAAAGDIHLLANEVYGLIKRRIAHEAERMGRSR